MTHQSEAIETVIVGGGQAGLSLSYYLSRMQREHVVLEKTQRAGSAWSRQRWDSFTLVTPNWAFCLPGMEYEGDDPHGFMPRDEVDRRFQAYVSRYALPLHCGVEVQSVTPLEKGYRVETTERTYQARNVVMATGMFQRARVPAWAKALPPEIQQVTAADYRNPAQLPPGATLVVGSGQSGSQIVEELNQSGRKVYLSVGSAGRFPRRYRGRDGFEWAMVTGFLDRTVNDLPSPVARFGPNPQLTGKDGGHSLNLHQFHRNGITLLGHVLYAQDGRLVLSPDLKESLAKADQVERDFVQLVDDTIRKRGFSDPPEELPQLADGFSAPEILSLELKAADIASVVWAGGFRFDFSPVKLPAFDSYGFPITQRGKTQFPGLYFLGLPWLHTFKSGLLFGVGGDAAWVAQEIEKEMRYSLIR